MIERWVKLHESTLESQVFADPWLLKLFIWCLIRANFKDKKIGGQTVKRGSFVTGRFVATEELSCSPMQWYRGIKRLAEIGCITVDSDNKKTTLTVCNYERYQNVKSPPVTQVNNGCYTDEQQLLHQCYNDVAQVNTEEERKKAIKVEGKNTLSPEPPKASAVLYESEIKFPIFPCTGEPRLWALPDSKVAQYASTFDTLDVPGELRRAWQWILDNRAKRKTAGGMLRFLNAWLDKAANRGTYQPGSNTNPPKPKILDLDGLANYQA